MMKTFLATASVLALMSVPAFAQDPAPAPAPPPAATDDQPDAYTPPPRVTTEPSDQTYVKEDQAALVDMSSGQWRTSRLIGQVVRNGANETIGDINDFIVDNTGKITSVVVGVGGFLGMGEKIVALTFDQLSISRDSNNSLVVMANATKESLEAAPEWVDPAKPSNSPAK